MCITIYSRNILKIQILADTHLWLKCCLEAIAFKPDASGQRGIVAASLPQRTVILTIRGCCIVAVEPFWAVNTHCKRLFYSPNEPVVCRVFSRPQRIGRSKIIVFPNIIIAFFSIFDIIPNTIAQCPISERRALHHSRKRKKVIVFFFC